MSADATQTFAVARPRQVIGCTCQSAFLTRVSTNSSTGTCISGATFTVTVDAWETVEISFPVTTIRRSGLLLCSQNLSDSLRRRDSRADGSSFFSLRSYMRGPAKSHSTEDGDYKLRQANENTKLLVPVAVEANPFRVVQVCNPCICCGCAQCSMYQFVLKTSDFIACDECKHVCKVLCEVTHHIMTVICDRKYQSQTRTMRTLSWLTCAWICWDVSSTKKYIHMSRSRSRSRSWSWSWSTFICYISNNLKI